MNNIKKQRNKVVRVQIIKLRLFIMLFFVVTMLTATYITLLGMSVKSVVERKEAELQVASLRAEIAKMEHEYITRVADITQERAGHMGLVKVASKNFTERRVLVGQAD